MDARKNFTLQTAANRIGLDDCESAFESQN
jgi:hypothetical protein